MPENDKTGTEEENFSLRCVHDLQKHGGKSLRRSEPLCSAAMIQKRLERSTRLLNGLKNHEN